MNVADWVILAIIAISTLISIKRGFIKEALSLLIWLAAFIVARAYSLNLSTLLVDWIDTPSIRLAAAFAILFVATLVVGSLLNMLLASLVKMSGLSGTDRLLGMVFGMARGGLVVIVLLILLKSTPVINDVWWGESILVHQFLLMEDWTVQVFRDLKQAISGE